MALCGKGITHYHTMTTLAYALEEKLFENILGKEENAGNVYTVPSMTS